ncbi:MAG: response regulator [Elusimicrobia bacterium]|nr:response regulator [Elusimicrobiota bacterium]
MPERAFTTHDVARLCDASPSSVVNWINDGRLKSFHTPGGHHRVSREDLIAFIRSLKMPLPPELSARRRVLVVDDEPGMARAIEKAYALRADEFEVETCGDGIDALIRIGRRPPDLVVLDVVLPKMDGLRVCRVLKSKPETRGIRIVAISGKRPPFSEKRLAETGIDAFYRKPVDLIALLETSVRLLGLPPSRATR